MLFIIAETTPLFKILCLNFSSYWVKKTKQNLLSSLKISPEGVILLLAIYYSNIFNYFKHVGLEKKPIYMGPTGMMLCIPLF